MIATLNPEGTALTLEYLGNVTLAKGWTPLVVGGNVFRHIHDRLRVILTVQRERDGRRWVHVSLSTPDRLPTWDELKRAKSIFVGDDRTALQVLPPLSEYVNRHPYCLHLWYCLDGDVVPDFRHDGEV
jgi:hypothetical protein